MSLRIRTTIEGIHKFLDIYEDEPVLMEFSFAELQDITQKNSAFSQSFNLPGTKNNNDIFNYYYNVSALPLDFNPNNKFETILSWDGYEILQGNIRLNNVTIDKDEIIYNITFYNQVGDLAANIGDKFLLDLDLSNLSHPYSSDVVLESNIDYNLFPITGNTNYSYQNGKTMWGLYNIGYSYISGNSVDTSVSALVQFSPFSGGTYTPVRGNFDFPQTPVNDYYYKPTLQIKELYTQICNEAGYKISSEFFDTNYFERFYMPLKFLDETIYARNAVPLCFSYNVPITNLYDDTIEEYLDPSLDQTCNNLNLTSTSTYFTIPLEYTGLYTIKFVYQIDPSPVTQITFFNSICPTACQYYYTDDLGNYQSGNITCPPSPVVVSGINPYGTCNFSYDFFPTASLFFTDGTTDVQLRNDVNMLGQPLLVSFEREFNVTGTSSNLGFYFKGVDVDIVDFKLEITISPRFLISGSTINYGEEFPANDYKQIDFISSVNRYFNLVMVPDPDYPKQLIVEPIIDYIGKGDVLDWTTKIDRSQPINIQPTTSILNGTLDFNFQLDQDYANQNFKSAANQVFGTDKFKLGVDYKDATTSFNTMFSSPIDITINSSYENMLTLPSFSKITTKDNSGVVQQNFLPFRILPRLIFRGPVLPNDNYGFVGTSGSSPYQNYYMRSFGFTNVMERFQVNNRFDTYPFNYNGFSHYCNFRGEDVTTIQPPEYQFVAEDLYDVYYKDYIDDLTSAESKIMSAKIYLYPNEIKELRYNEKILIDNNYFRINKISNFNMLEPSICDIELIKLTKEYQGHRILYYDLLPCDSGTTLYSNSDINFNLYAYADRFVKLFNDNLDYLGCYEVKIGSYNPLNDYQHYYISSAYTQNLVEVFLDCGCEGRTAFIVVQETPEPSPTPSNTPGLSPTPTPTPGLSPTPTASITPTITPTNTNTPTPSVTFGLTPTATPTPEPTPTPSETPPPVFNCTEWRNRSFEVWYGQYQDCCGEFQYNTFVQEDETICAVDGSIIRFYGPPLVEGPICSC